MGGPYLNTDYNKAKFSFAAKLDSWIGTPLSQWDGICRGRRRVKTLTSRHAIVSWPSPHTRDGIRRGRRRVKTLTSRHAIVSGPSPHTRDGICRGRRRVKALTSRNTLVSWPSPHTCTRVCGVSGGPFVCFNKNNYQWHSTMSKNSMYVAQTYCIYTEMKHNTDIKSTYTCRTLPF